MSSNEIISQAILARMATQNYQVKQLAKDLGTTREATGRRLNQHTIWDSNELDIVGKALGQSTRKPAAIQGGANLTTTQSTLTINVPAEGLYYITDSAGNPIMIGTKSGNANIMKNDAKDPQWRTLGTAVVKAKSVRVDKKV